MLGGLGDRLNFLITADPDNAIKAFQKTSRSADKDLGNAESRVDKLGNRLTAFGTGALAAAGIAGAGLFKLGGNFQDLAIKAGKFSDATGISVQDASRWIEVSDDMGISAETVQTAIGKLLKAVDPKVFKDLGVQIAYTKDGLVDSQGTFLNAVDAINNTADASKRAQLASDLFGRGWQGMSELIRTGSPELKKALASVSDQKVIDPDELARAKDYRADLDALKDAADDLGLAIGKGVTPIIGGLSKVVATGVEWIAKLDEVSSGAAGGMLAGGTAALGMAGAVSTVVGQAIKMKARFTDAEGGLTKMGKVGVGVMGAVGLATIAASAHAAEMAKHTAKMNEAFAEMSRVADDEVIAQFARAVTSGVLAGKDLNGVMKELATNNLEGAKRLRDTYQAQVDANGATGEQRKQLDALNEAITKEDAARAQASKTTADYAESTDVATAAQIAARTATEALADSQARSKKLAEQQERAWDNLFDTLSHSNDLIDLADGFDDMKVKAQEAWDAAASGAADATQKGRDYERSVNDQKAAVATYAQEVLKLPVSRTTQFLALLDKGAFDEVQRQLNILTANRTMELSIIAKGGSGFTDYNGKKASGGYGSGRTLVGENGPEVVDLPDGSYVNPAGESRNMLGGTTYVDRSTHNYNLPPSVDVRSLQRAQREQERRGVGR